MRIFVQRSKTDIYRDGAWVVISKTFKPTCPVLLPLRYFAVASFSEDSEDFIFRPLSFCSSNGSYRFRGSVPLSYSRAREIVLCTFEAIGLSRRDYGLHSLKAGGASAAANAQVSDRLFKRHGPTLRIIFFLCCLFLCHWVFNLFSRSFSSFYTRLMLTHPISGCLLHDKCFIFG